MIRKYLPSKIVVSILIIPILALSTVFIINEYSKRNNKDTSSQNKLKAMTEALTAEKDTDKDGLLDWEEELIGTDIYKEDTDGDGFSDGFEVKVGSDPIDPLNKSSQDLELLDEINKNTNYDYLTKKDLTLTEKAAAQFLEEGMKLQRSGMGSNKDAQMKVIGGIIARNKISLQLTKYSKEDLSIEGNSTEKFKHNLENIFSILEDKKLTEESLLLNEYLSTENIKYTDEIKSNVKFYKSLLKNLLKVKVPQKHSSAYLKYLNAFNLWIQEIEYFGKAANDPIAMIQIIGVYKMIDQKYLEAVKELRTEIK